MAMDKEFEEWYQQNERRFHCGHFDEKQIAYSAWIEGRNRALSMSGVVESADFPSINNEGTPLLDEYGKKICNCVDPNRTYFPDGAIVCMNCWGEWYH